VFDDMTERDGVLIGDGRCSVRLTRADWPNELGYPTIIAARAGPFHGAVRDDTVHYEPFREQLGMLYKDLSGSAKLGSYEGFELNLIGGGTGGIEGRVRIIGEQVPLIQLSFEFFIDQSYLPGIMDQLDIEFPAPYRNWS
jgi:hypothetical protein